MGSGQPYYPIDPWSLEGLLFNCSAMWLKVNFLKLRFSATSKETIRKSIDESQFLIKYFIRPSFIADGEVLPVSVMDHEAALALMATDAWTDPNGPHE